MRKTSKLFYSVSFCTMTLCLMLVPGSIAFAAKQIDSTGISVKNSIENTLAYHHQLKSIQESRQAAIHAVQRAEAGWFPSVDVMTQTGQGYSEDLAGRARYDTDLASNTYNKATAGLTLSQPLWDGLATYHRVKVAEIQQASLDNRVVDTATTLALEATIAHAYVLLRRELLVYAHENVKQHINILNDQKVLTKDGVSTIANVYQIEGRLSRTRAQLIDSQAALREAEENYLRVTGTAAPPVLKNTSMPLPEVMFKDAQACYDTAQKYNPKILAYLSDSKRALEMEKLATAAYHPNINLELSSNIEHKGDEYVDGMLVMRWNLFSGGADVASKRIANAEYRVARQEAFNIADTIKQESYNAWTRYVSSLGQEKSYAEAIEYNTKTKAGFLEQFLIGERGLLDVLDSYSELYNSYNQWATMRTNTYISAYTMFALAGRLLEQFNIDNAAVLIAP